MTTEQLHNETLEFCHYLRIEVSSARQKFPSPNCNMIALMEEVGELANALLEVKRGNRDPKEIWEEAVQVAAMACRVATEGDPTVNLLPL